MAAGLPAATQASTYFAAPPAVVIVDAWLLR